jgi:hypothetical protein
MLKSMIMLGLSNKTLIELIKKKYNTPYYGNPKSLF